MEAPPLTPLAAAALHVGEPERVLEVECGEGDGALFLAREFPRARVRGVDRSERALARASARVGLDPEGRIAFKLGRPGALPFPDQQFDLLAQADSSPKPREAARVLRPGGFLILATTHPQRDPFGLRQRRLRRRLRRHGLDPVLEEAAGEGSFLLARLRGGQGARASG
jgi:ubiquinone/menaquinone biosynthesis C-methylase UbiE